MSAPSLQRTIALCYVRRSMTRNPEDYISPERQMDNIRLVCQQNGWTPEWYTDVKGHKSGREEKNRPGWLALKNRLADPDVVALVANDLSRLHRNGWRINDLFDLVDNHNLRLVMADPVKPLDLSTPEGRVSAQLEALHDEWYSREIGQHLKSSIEYRKRKGVTIGLPPFGTVRDSEGYLMPSSEGAWLMPGRTFQKGTADESPHPQAVWRSYYEAAERILRLFSADEGGAHAIATRMNNDGWPMRDRWGNPKPMNGDDIRRVIANWPEYGGYVSTKRARERDPRECNPDTVQLNPERAVFPIDLLIQVGKIRLQRAGKYGSDVEERAPKITFPLSGLLYCYHCELMAQKHDNPRLRTRFKGNTHNKSYVHKEGVSCGCTRQSVAQAALESDFARLLDLLIVPSDKIDFAQLQMQTPRMQKAIENSELENEKQAAILKCNNRIKAARALFLDGEINEDEYRKRKEQNEREIARWNNTHTTTDQEAMELLLCLNTLDRIKQLWAIVDVEQKQGMARQLFEYLLFNLDTQQITDFQLKPWAARFVILSQPLY